MNARRTYKRYPKEFKEEAVALVREQGYTLEGKETQCFPTAERAS
ncbi:hypothetical protein ACBZ90_17945 (plasmid) [Vibrio alginolyticus]